MSKKNAYICGPMTGYKDDNRPAFRHITAQLREAGLSVTSADELDERDPATSKQWADFLRRDIPWVIQADLLVCLPGWRMSRGATLEATIAAELGIPVYESHLDGSDYVWDFNRPLSRESLPKPMYNPGSLRAPPINERVM